MTKLINFLTPFTPMKIAIINALLTPMPVSTREIVLDRVIAKQLPKHHIKYRPYQVNPKRKEA
jgi:hypothetical protein